MKTVQEQSAWMKERLEHLKTLRDEIRVDLHLAGMEAKQRWEKLEPKLEEAERLVENLSLTSKAGMEEVLVSFREFREALARQNRN